MAYIGASGALTNQATAADVFSGNGSNTQFTLSRTVYNTRDIEVVVNNVQQNPFDGSYSVSGQTLTLSGAPSAGANNIYVNYQLGIIGAVAPTDNSVTANSLTSTAITGKLGYTPANKAGDTFTGNVVVSNATSGSFIVGANTPSSIGGNQIVAQVHGSGTTSNLGAVGAISWANNTGYGGNFMMAKSASNTVGTHAAVTSGMELGAIAFAGSNGSQFATGILVQGWAGNTWTGSTSESYLTLATTSPGATMYTERVRFPSVGGMAIGTAIGSSPGFQNTSMVEIKASAADRAQIQLTQENATDGWKLNASSNGGYLGFIRVGSSLNAEAARFDNAGNFKLTASGTKVLNSSGSPILAQTGSILQHVQVAKTTATTSTCPANGWAEFDSAFRLTITPSSSSNKILLASHITAGQTTGTIRYLFQFSTDGGSNWTTCSPVGNASSNHGIGHSTFGVHSDANQACTTSFELLHSPGTTNACIYRVLFGVDVNTTYFFNRSPNYYDSFLGGTYTSTMIAKEVVA